MSSSFGNRLKVSLFGESHGEVIGMVLDGLSSGHEIDKEALVSFMKRRAPKKTLLSTGRKEGDKVKFVSGVLDNHTTGTPICAMILNEDAHSSDYQAMRDVPRPSHADYTARLRYGDFVDLRGGGHFSGRLTAPLCIAGGLALQILEKQGIRVYTHLKSVGEIEDKSLNYAHPDEALLQAVAKKDVGMLDSEAGKSAKAMIEEARANGDSVGGVIECVILGFPAGKGNPLFDSLESNLAKLLFGISGVKGVSFGSGFLGCQSMGSLENDPFEIKDGLIKTKTNNSGGIQGGISNGMPIIFQVGMKPTASIAKKQESVSLSEMKNKALQIVGRHDPCIALRAMPVIEAVSALVLLDELM